LALNIGFKFYLPEEIFPNVKTLTYPFTKSFKEQFKGLVSSNVIGMCLNQFKSSEKKSSKKKVNMDSNLPEPCEFLKQFKTYKRNKKIKFSLKQMFSNGENFSHFLDNYYQKNQEATYFDLETLNQDLSIAQKITPGFQQLQKLLKKKEKQIFLMFGFQGSGKSYFCREHLSSTHIISNVL
jgi:hypothetical protein